MSRDSASASSTKRRVLGPANVTKRVIVIASGETERRALPHLLSHLRERGVSVDDVRIPPRNMALTAPMAENLLKAVWYENAGAPPDKFVLLVDVDGKDPDEVLRAFTGLHARLGREIEAAVICAYAQWHLEAWYFADAGNLRKYLGGALGHVDTSKPDAIRNPKHRLKQLLGNRFYTARVSQEIAKALDAKTVAQRSPSFKGFLDAVMNGA